jgi:hypothetical protein
MHENEKKDKYKLELRINCAFCGKGFVTSLTCEDLGVKRIPSRMYNHHAMMRSKRLPETLEIECTYCHKLGEYKTTFDKGMFTYKAAKKNKAESKE